METAESQLRKGIEEKLTIRDDVKNKQLYFDAKNIRKCHLTKARYNKQPRDKALSKIEKKKRRIR